MTPNAQARGATEFRRSCDPSLLCTDTAANGTRALRRRKSGLDVRSGGSDDEYDVLTESRDQTEEDFSSFSNFSEDHAQHGGACSRRSSGSSRSSSSESELDRQYSELYNCGQDTSEFVGPSRIEESDSELAKDEEPQPPLDPVDKSTNDAIARAPLRGQGLPVIESRPKAGGSTDRTEITDLGGRLYASLKIDGEAPPVDSPSNRWATGLSLQDRIFSERCQPQEEHKGFFPIGCLESLIQQKDVVDELTKCLSETITPRKIQDYARQICPAPPAKIRKKDKKPPKTMSYRMVFAILVLIERVATIGKFLDEEIHDGDLPLRKVEFGQMPGAFELRRRNERSLHLQCFDTWSRISILNFEEWQWTVLAPFFTRGRRNDVKNYVLPDQTVLPFTKDSRRQDDVRENEDFEGGFGRVFKVKIHPHHHNFHNPKVFDRAFAIKRLNTQDMQLFMREFDMLSKFSDDAHDHLVSLLTAYKQFNAFHLIFHWADADLSRFWRLVKQPDFTYERVVWVAKQCAGLASGLFKIHRYESIYEPQVKSAGAALDEPETRTCTKLYGRHGDIKPANILWFRDPKNPNDLGTLKISDFGLAELHTIHSRSNRPKSQVAFTPNYRPPEYDLINGKISRSYDIWTIACLYLEFITWLLGGWSLVKSFNIMRAGSDEGLSPELKEYTFFELENGGKSARIKNCVSEFIEYLHSRPACTEYLHEFLNMIEYDMLLIETSDLETGKRIECGKLCQKLDEMYRRCDNNPAYASTPAAWIRGAVG